MVVDQRFCCVVICSRLVYAAGISKAKSKLFQERQGQVLEALKPVEHKLFCLYLSPLISR